MNIRQDDVMSTDVELQGLPARPFCMHSLLGPAQEAVRGSVEMLICLRSAND